MIPTVIIKPIQKIVLPVFMMPIPNMIKLYFEDSNIKERYFRFLYIIKFF